MIIFSLIDHPHKLGVQPKRFRFRCVNFVESFEMVGFVFVDNDCLARFYPVDHINIIIREIIVLGILQQSWI